MEGWYPSYTLEDSAFVDALTRRLGLIKTGGTDFHGANRPGIEMGTGLEGNITVPEEALARLKESVAARRRQAGI